MKRLIQLAIILILAFSVTLSAKDKKPFTISDIMKFKTVRYSGISTDGAWMYYSMLPDRGDGTSVFRKINDTINFRLDRGILSKISRNSQWGASIIVPKLIEIENAKTPKDKPKNSLSLLKLSTGKTYDLGNANNKYEFSNDSKWLIYQSISDDAKDDKGKNKDKAVGNTLILRHLNSGSEINIDNVTDYVLDSNSVFLFYSVSNKSGERDGIYYRNLNEEFAPENEIKTAKNAYFGNLIWHNELKKLAYFFAKTTESGKAKDCSIWVWDSKINNSIADSNNIPKNYYLPSFASAKWSKPGNRIYFGIKPVWQKMPDNDDKKQYTDSNLYNIDTIMSKSSLNLWHWNDQLIMPNQQNIWKKVKDQTYSAVFDFDENKLVQLGDSTLSLVIPAEYSNYAVAYDDVKYQKAITWYGNYFDIYSVNQKTGKRTLVDLQIEETGDISPNGKFIVYYKNKIWYSYNNETGTKKDLTSKINNPFYDLKHDVPSSVPSKGIAAWANEGNSVLIKDNYDIWLFDLTSNTFVNITNSKGAETNTSFSIKEFDKEKLFYNIGDTLLLTSFNNKDKSYGFSRTILGKPGVETLLHKDRKFNLFAKADYADQYLITQEGYDEFPNIWLTNSSFKLDKQLTDANPEMKDYKWGHTKLVEWENTNGDTLQGVLILPDDYNPKKKYPVLVYFYEQFSDYLHHFFTPQINHRPCYQVYMSDGYIVFMPDIKYRDKNGFPGQDAMDAILTGSKMLIKAGYADEKAFCIQGHSWGAYQTAYIASKTDFFKAACAGAPVGNMTSAYSGIRLESGMTRQFQYEAQQSRIGGTLWDSLGNYIENSPIFSAPTMNTPLLIMHGDIDEAVPFQQSVEIYMTLRRLGKPVYFIEYPDEPHHPRKYQNKLDYAVKMKEFFDHFVLGTKAPDWILNGIPYQGK